MMRVPDGSVRLAVQGTERMKILEWVSEEPFLMARVEVWPEKVGESVEVEALTRNTLDLFQRMVSLVSHLPDELVTAALNVEIRGTSSTWWRRISAWSRKSGRRCLSLTPSRKSWSG